MVCLDTSCIIDLFRGHATAKSCIARLEANDETITVAAPTIVELVGNASLNQNKKEKEDILKLLSSIVILDLDKESAMLAGEIEAHLIMAGNLIGTIDIMIGAIARNNN